MTGKERLEAVFRGEEPDHIPWAPLLDDFFMRSLPADKKGISIIELLRELEADVLLRHIPAPYANLQTGPVTAKSERVGDTASTRTVWSTPWGTLTEVDRAVASAETSFKSEFPVKKLEDWDVMARIWENAEVQGDFAQTDAVVQSIGEDGLATISGPPAPLVGILNYRDAQEAIFDLVDSTGYMLDISARIHEKLKVVYERLCQGPVDTIISYSANLTTRLISPAIAREFALPNYRDYARICHRHGKKLIIHTCGDVAALLPIFKEAGLDGVDSLSLPRLGDTTMTMIRKELGDEFTVIGGVNPVVLSMGSLWELEEHVRGFFDDLSTRKGLILCVSDATPYGTPLENLRLVSRLVREL